MASVPSPTVQLQSLCIGLDLDDCQLVRFMDVFRSEIVLGIGDSPGNTSLKCSISYIETLPSGNETGSYLSLHFSGDTIRVAHVKINNKNYDLRSKKYIIPKELLSEPGWKLFDFLAQCIYEFTAAKKINMQSLPLTFVFGFPCNQLDIKTAVLTQWAREFKCPEAVGKDVVAMLKNAISKIKDLHVNVCAVINDTTETLLSCAWMKPNCKIGVVHDEGTNICYVEKNSNIKKCRLDDNALDGSMIITTECGNMGTNGNLDSLRTGWDKELDKITKYPGTNLFEKMISGKYLGEIVRRILVTAIQRNIIFEGKISKQMSNTDAFETKYITEITQEPTTATRNVLEQLGYSTPRLQDCVDLQFVCERVLSRSATLLAASISSLLEHMDHKNVCIGFGGTLYQTNARLQEIVQNKIRELTNPSIECHILDVRGGLGAALAAAVTTSCKRNSPGTTNTTEQSSLHLQNVFLDSMFPTESTDGALDAGTANNTQDLSVLMQKHLPSNSSGSESSGVSYESKVSRLRSFESIHWLHRRESKKNTRNYNEAGEVSESFEITTKTPNPKRTVSDKPVLSGLSENRAEFINQSAKSQINVIKEVQKNENKIRNPEDMNVHKSRIDNSGSSIDVSKSLIQDAFNNIENDFFGSNSEIDKSLRNSITPRAPKISASLSSNINEIADKEMSSLSENKLQKLHSKESGLGSKLETRRNKLQERNSDDERRDMRDKGINSKEQPISSQGRKTVLKSKTFDEPSKTDLPEEGKIENMKETLENTKELIKINRETRSSVNSMEDPRKIRKPPKSSSFESFLPGKPQQSTKVLSNLLTDKTQGIPGIENSKYDSQNIPLDQIKHEESEGSIRLLMKGKHQFDRDENHDEKAIADAIPHTNQHSRERLIHVKPFTISDISVVASKSSGIISHPSKYIMPQSKAVSSPKRRIKQQVVTSSALQPNEEYAKDREKQNVPENITRNQQYHKKSEGSIQLLRTEKHKFSTAENYDKMAEADGIPHTNPLSRENVVPVKHFSVSDINLGPSKGSSIITLPSTSRTPQSKTVSPQKRRVKQEVVAKSTLQGNEESAKVTAKQNVPENIPRDQQYHKKSEGSIQLLRIEKNEFSTDENYDTTEEIDRIPHTNQPSRENVVHLKPFSVSDINLGPNKGSSIVTQPSTSRTPQSKAVFPQKRRVKEQVIATSSLQANKECAKSTAEQIVSKNIPPNQQNRKESEGGIQLLSVEKNELSTDENYDTTEKTDGIPYTNQSSRENVHVKAFSISDISLVQNKGSSIVTRPSTDKTPQSKTVGRKKRSVEQQETDRSVLQPGEIYVKSKERQSASFGIQSNESKRELSNIPGSSGKRK